jgi:hypothetical protein
LIDRHVKHLQEAVGGTDRRILSVISIASFPDMIALPEGFRVLTGTDLLRAQTARENYIAGLAPAPNDGRTTGINDFSRIIRPIGSIDTDHSHLEAVRDAARTVGDAIGLIVTDASDRDEILGLEVKLDALCEFSSNTDFNAGADWIPESMESWPADAAEAAYPEEANYWSLLSPSESWGYLNTDVDDYDFTAIAGTAAFLREYRQRRPEAAFDVLIWLHNGSYGLINEPPLKWNWFRRRKPEGLPTRTRMLQRYMESLYSRDDSEWLWALYVETFTEGYGQQPLEGWKKFEEGLTARIKSDPQNEPRLQRIWDESRPS